MGLPGTLADRVPLTPPAVVRANANFGREPADLGDIELDFPGTVAIAVPA